MSGYLFDTNAFSELLRRRPNPDFVAWLAKLPREQQFTSTVVVAELLAGAHASAEPERWLVRCEGDILQRVTILPFDIACARTFGVVFAQLRAAGTPIGTADAQIAATALHHGLVVVTANARHFDLVHGLEVRAFTPGFAG